LNSPDLHYQFPLLLACFFSSRDSDKKLLHVFRDWLWGLFFSRQQSWLSDAPKSRHQAQWNYRPSPTFSPEKSWVQRFSSFFNLHLIFWIISK
jgi:hypothetical protein